MKGVIRFKEALVKKLVITAISVVFMLPLLTYPVWASPCNGDFDCDTDCDGRDAATFKANFGRSNFIDPCEPCFAALKVQKTGQTTSYAEGDDGDLRMGVACPNPRFTDNLDGTVTDNLTGLTWLQNANCFGPRTWSDALSDCNELASGSCGITDDSIAGDWRLPNRYELESLLNLKYTFPPISNTEGTGQWSEGDPFTSLQSDTYWSSTSVAIGINSAWNVGMHLGCLNGSNIAAQFYVWPVRGGYEKD